MPRASWKSGVSTARWRSSKSICAWIWRSAGSAARTGGIHRGLQLLVIGRGEKGLLGGAALGNLLAKIAGVQGAEAVLIVAPGAQAKKFTVKRPSHRQQQQKGRDQNQRAQRATGDGIVLRGLIRQAIPPRAFAIMALQKKTDTAAAGRTRREMRRREALPRCESALRGPSASNAEPWRYPDVFDPEDQAQQDFHRQSHHEHQKQIGGDDLQQGSCGGRCAARTRWSSSPDRPSKRPAENRWRWGRIRK